MLHEKFCRSLHEFSPRNRSNLEKQLAIQAGRGPLRIEQFEECVGLLERRSVRSQQQVQVRIPSHESDSGAISPGKRSVDAGVEAVDLGQVAEAFELSFPRGRCDGRRFAQSGGRRGLQARLTIELKSDALLVRRGQAQANLTCARSNRDRCNDEWPALVTPSFDCLARLGADRCPQKAMPV